MEIFWPFWPIQLAFFSGKRIGGNGHLLRLWRKTARKKGKGGDFFPLFFLSVFTSRIYGSPQPTLSQDMGIRRTSVYTSVPSESPPPKKCCTHVRHSPLYICQKPQPVLFFSSGAPLVVPPHSAGKVGFWAGRFSGRPEKGGEEGGYYCYKGPFSTVDPPSLPFSHRPHRVFGV